MAAIRAGDVRKLGLLFDRHHLALFRYAMRMTGNREWSEDLVQEIFCRILKYRETYREGSAFTTWMFRIAHNAFVDQTRKKRWEVQSEEGFEEVAVTPRVGLEGEQDLQLLRLALLKLPEPQRELLTLARFQEMPYDQIAELLGIEVATVKTRVHRAVKQLRDIYFELTRTPYALRTNS